MSRVLWAALGIAELVACIVIVRICDKRARRRAFFASPAVRELSRRINESMAAMGVPLVDAMREMTRAMAAVAVAVRDIDTEEPTDAN